MARRSIVEILIQAKDATVAGVRSALNRFNQLKQSLFSLNTLFATIATSAVVGFMKKLVSAFGEQEQAVIRLNTALRITNRYTEEGTGLIQEMSREMQRLTTVADEQALAISATIAQLATELTPKQLAEVQKAAIGLSQTFGIDLASAAVLVGKALAGERDILGRYGISLDTTASQQDRFNELMRKTAGFFDVAVGSAHSLTGQFQQAANALNDVEEALGEVIVKVFGLDTAGASLRDRLNQASDSIRVNMSMWVKIGKTITGTLAAVWSTFKNTVEIIVNFGVIVGNILLSIFQGMHLAIQKALNAVIREWDGFILRLPAAMQRAGVSRLLIGQISETAAEGLEQTKVDIRIAAKEIGESFAQIGDAWERVVKTLQTPAVPRVGAREPPSTAGGGANVPADPRKLAEDEARRLTSQATVIAQEFKVGAISTAEFRAEVEKLAPQMIALRNAGLLTDEMLIALMTAFDGLAQAIGELDALTGTGGGGGGSFMAGFRNAMIDGIDLIRHFDEELGRVTHESVVEFTMAMAEAFGKVAEGSVSAAQAFRNAMLEAIASIASNFGQLYAARAAGEVAAFIAGNPKAAVAAAKFFAASATMFALAGAARRGIASGSGGAASGTSVESAQARAEAVSDTRGEAELIIEGALLDMSDPKQADAMIRAMEALEGRRLTRVTVR